MKTIKNESKIVVIGGGTGSFSVLSGIKKYFNNITALVSMADDGGSTGQLRDEYGVLPAGDVRQCLVALSKSPKIRDLFNYRFEDGGLNGHSFGNLFLTALEKTTGNFREGIELASQILRVRGVVEPITLDKVVLAIKDGTSIIRHEHNIDIRKFKCLRPEIWLEPKPRPNPAAIEAIKKAKIIIIAPGDLYTSLGAALVVPNIGAALKKSRARKIYICNLINKPGQTDGFSPIDYAEELERMAGQQFIDVVLYNNRRPSRELLEKYADDGELPVRADSQERRAAAHFQMISANLIDKRISSKSPSDKLKRSFIRHNPDLIAHNILREA
ncbi:MAG: YvcK family protein [Candidatus Nomurabacteria bacterium]|jgi:uncharacterized cofD-like protein|nr:YvcK family protein [Candidatus Nomurabacteria bacterium]